MYNVLGCTYTSNICQCENTFIGFNSIYEKYASFLLEFVTLSFSSTYGSTKLVHVT